MHPDQKTLGWIILLGGLAVVGSYFYGVLAGPSRLLELWGNTPTKLLPLYMVNMFLGAAGFFAFSTFLLFRIDPEETRFFRSSSLTIFNWIYLGILIPSALWTPLALMMLEQPSTVLWLLIRAVLVLTGVASLALITALLTLRPQQSSWPYRLAVAGAVFFCLQTCLLDALVWPMYFPVQ
jgi:hypothetical protein